jgi:flagellar protein FliO/FliZ
MFDLFGAEMPLAVRFFLAFLIVLGLIGAAAWAVRRFGSARLGGAVRGRQPRLAVIDYASVDARRRLILVRRDNVEHLVMIGGPTDVVVESNIVRAVPAARDVPAARPPAGVETLPRAIPLPEVGSNGTGGSWPLQPEPAGTTPSREPPLREQQPPPRPQREVLTALADDIAAHPMPALPPLPSRSRTGPAPRAHPVEPRLEPRVAPQSIGAETASAADHSLAEMAQRLEAALRRPKATDKPVEVQTSAVPVGAAPAPESAPEEAAAVEARPSPRPARPAEAKPARVEAQPDTRLDTKSKEGKLYDTLEQEMASLLGRPPGKAG